MTLTVGMPQMAANGLSENWLFRHCGDLHWRRICACLGVRSAALRDDRGRRLYPTFVAIAARYSAPLSAVRENDTLEESAAVAHFGQSFFRSEIAVHGEAGRYALEMLTAFVVREEEGRNDLAKSTPEVRARAGSTELVEPPDLLLRSQAMRRGEAVACEVAGRRFDLAGPGLDLVAEYEPSPYIDYNGADLLYFAAYPTIADTLERRLVTEAGLGIGGRDWAMATSTVARDVYYHGNLDVGARLRGRLRVVEREGDEVATHMRLTRLDDDGPLADVFTLRRVLD